MNGESNVHTGIAMLGSAYSYKDEEFSYKGTLVMVQDARRAAPSEDWGLFELYRRNWALGSASGAWCPGDGHIDPALSALQEAATDSVDGWHRIEVLVVDERIRVVLNGRAIQDYRDPDPALLAKGPIGLQLH